MRNWFDVNTNSKEVLASAISKLRFPFHLKGHQLEAVTWISSDFKGSIIPPNLISCNYKDVVTARVRVFELTNLC